MAKIGIISHEKYWWNFRYTGIRSIAVSLKYSYEQLGHDVSLLSFKNKESFSFSNLFGTKQSSYTFQFVADEEVVNSNFHIKDHLLEGRSVFSFVKTLFQNLKQNKPAFNYDLIADDIQSYDVLFFMTNWHLMPLASRILPRQKVFVLFHDNLPLLNNFTSRSGSFLSFFANSGIEEAFRRKFNILCVSKQAREQMTAFYFNAPYFDNKLILDLPQIVLPVFYSKPPAQNTKEMAVVLGNVHSKRKRLDYAIQVLKRTKNVKKLYVYGGNAKIKHIIKSFLSLKGKMEIEWYTVASTNKVLDILDKSSILLFPSDFEGIGIPIIEAQLRGLKVLSQNKSPMKDLLFQGSKTLSMNPDFDAQLLDEIITQKNDVKNDVKNDQNVIDKFSLSTFIEKCREIIK